MSYGYPYFYDFEASDDTYDWWVGMDFETIRQGDYLLVNRGVLNDRYEEPGYLQLLRNSIASKGFSLEFLEERGKVTLMVISEF